MSYLDTYHKKVKEKVSKSSISRLVGDLIIINSPNMINAVKARWLIGKSVDGGIIGRYSNDDYRAYKMSLNPKAGGNVDLTLTGALSDNLTIRKTGSNIYEIFSTDEKYNSIGVKYGFEEFGLTEQEMSEMLNEIYSFALETILNDIWKWVTVLLVKKVFQVVKTIW